MQATDRGRELRAPQILMSLAHIQSLTTFMYINDFFLLLRNYFITIKNYRENPFGHLIHLSASMAVYYFIYSIFYILYSLEMLGFFCRALPHISTCGNISHHLLHYFICQLQKAERRQLIPCTKIQGRKEAAQAFFCSKAHYLQHSDYLLPTVPKNVVFNDTKA